MHTRPHAKAIILEAHRAMSKTHQYFACATAPNAIWLPVSATVASAYIRKHTSTTASEKGVTHGRLAPLGQLGKVGGCSVSWKIYS